MGRSYNELPLLQLQRQHERQEDKARLRLQPGLLSGSDSQRQRGFPQAEQTQFRSQAGNVSRELPGAARSGGFGAAILASLLQCHHSSVSTTVLSDYLFRFFCERDVASGSRTHAVRFVPNLFVRLDRWNFLGTR